MPRARSRRFKYKLSRDERRDEKRRRGENFSEAISLLSATALLLIHLMRGIIGDVVICLLLVMVRVDASSAAIYTHFFHCINNIIADGGDLINFFIAL